MVVLEVNNVVLQVLQNRIIKKVGYKHSWISSSIRNSILN